jgi:hypothetical protein
MKKQKERNKLFFNTLLEIKEAMLANGIIDDHCLIWGEIPGMRDDKGNIDTDGLCEFVAESPSVYYSKGIDLIIKYGGMQFFFMALNLNH